MGMASVTRNLATVAVAVLVAACGTGAPNQRGTEYLDDATGATITRVDQPFVLFSDDPARAANARDYISVAPLAVNQSGKRSWWLWLGLWSTIDRGVSVGDARLADVAAIQLIVDGEPMELDLAAATGRIPGVTGLPYAAPVGTARTLVLPLTGSQVTRLGRGNGIVIRTQLTSGAALVWQPWIGSGAWTHFAELAAADSRATP
ncbi:MAG: hypothetical protein JNK40_05425 [Chromatiales bacterium]|nr:hypothetical protein [Chromatiales bacterium]